MRCLSVNFVCGKGQWEFRRRHPRTWRRDKENRRRFRVQGLRFRLHTFKFLLLCVGYAEDVEIRDIAGTY